MTLVFPIIDWYIMEVSSVKKSHADFRSPNMAIALPTLAVHTYYYDIPIKGISSRRTWLPSSSVRIRSSRATTAVSCGSLSMLGTGRGICLDM